MATKFSFKKLRKANVKRLKESYPECQYWTLMQWGCCIAGEAGEFCNYTKKHTRLKQDSERATKSKELKAEMAKELADIILYCDLAADFLEINLDEAIVSKFNEVSDRVGSKIKI